MLTKYKTFLLGTGEPALCDLSVSKSGPSTPESLSVLNEGEAVK